MRKIAFVCMLVLSLVVFAAAMPAALAQTKVMPHQQPDGEASGFSAASYGAFDNPDYYYAPVKTAPSGTYYRQAGLSPDGMKVVAQKSWNDGTYNRVEVVLMNADGTNETVISPGDSGQGDIQQYGNPFWSDDGTAVGYVESHVANPNKVVRYNLADSTRTYIYEPVGMDANNCDFLGSSKTSIVCWDWIAADGAADLFIWDGSARTYITGSTDYSEYEPVSNGDGTVIVYWSGETTAEPVNTTHTLTYSGGTWTKDVGFTPISDSYWSGWSGRADNYIATTVMSSKDILIYDSAGTLVTDLTGPGYSGGSGQWNFFGVLAEGPNGNWVITSNAARTDAGRDIVCAASRQDMYVASPPLGSDANCGTEAAPFATVQKGVTEVASGGTVHVAAGTYVEIGQIVIGKNLTIVGADKATTIIKPAQDTGSSGNAKGWWLIQPGSDLNLSHVTLDGTGYKVLQGLRFNGHGTIDDVAFTEIKYNPSGPDYAGLAVVAFGDGPVNVSGSGFSQIGRVGVLYYGATVAGSTFHGNTYTGKGVGNWLDYALDISAGAVVAVTDNTISGCQGVATSDGSTSAGILVTSYYGAGTQATITGNVLTGNTTGITVGYDASDTSIVVAHGNSIYGNTSYGISSTGPAVDAEDNWWGSANGPVHTSNTFNVGAQGDTADDGIDFVPWLNAAPPVGVSFAPVTTNNPPGKHASIQAGVDYSNATGTVSAVAGTFTEQVEIAKNVIVDGVGPGTIVLSPDTLTKYFATSANNYPVIYIHDANSVTIQDLVVDGAGKGNANYRFDGIAFHNAGGTVQNCTIKDIRDTPLSGGQHGVAVYAYNTDEIARTVNVWDNTITGFQKNAMALNAGDTTPLAVDVQRNVVTGAGTTAVTAQNGIQVWADNASGTVAGNTISGIAYNGSGWVASSVLNYDADLNINDNTINDAHMGIYNIDGAGQLNGNTLTIIKTAGFGYGICATDPPGAVPSPFGVQDMGDPAKHRGSVQAAALDALVLDMSNNTVTFSGTDNTGTSGLEADAGYGADDIALTANNNVVTGFGVGIGIYKCTSGCGVGVFTSLSANGNCLSNNTYGSESNVDYLVTNGTLNWWGDPTGPFHATKNAGGLGDDVSDYIDFEPWITDGCHGTVNTGHWKNLRTNAFDDLAGSLAAALSGDTIQGVCSGTTPIPGGGTANIANVTIDLHGCTVGPGSSFLTVNADDVAVLGPGILDGASSTAPAIVVKAGADNFILQGVEIKRWSDGVFLEGSVISFKMAENFIHNNSNVGLRVGTGASLGGIVTIEGNLFKDNTGVGIQNDGATNPLPATYNSWGDLAGPAGPLGDGVGTGVSYTPWTFAELFLDMKPDDEAVVRHVLETTAFDVKLKADAAKLYGLTFVFTYDTAKLALGPITFAAPWAGRCVAVPGLLTGAIGYFCNLLNEVPPDPEWNADGGTIATFHFTAFTGTPGNGPWPALFDISHLETDTSASAIGGQKVFVNNAGFNAPTIPRRDITDPDDGQIIIERGANYTGFVDLQGRLSDSLAWCRVYNQATIAGATKLAEGSSASSGAYTTAWVLPNWLGIGNTYHVVVDRWLFLSTTAYAATTFGHSRILDAYPLTGLPNVYLLGGDATNDERILVNDLSCIGGDYGKTSGFVTCGGTGLSDVNEDGRVNVQDLSLAGGNLYKTFSPWTVP